MKFIQWLLSFFFKKKESSAALTAPAPELPKSQESPEAKVTGDAGRALIKKSEGLRLESYLDDVGVPTIAWGHTGPEVAIGQKITLEDAEELLKKDLKKFEDGVNRLVTASLNQNQFDALVCFSYNVGLGALGRSTLLKKLNAGDYAGAADQFLVWNKAGGNVLPGLTKRRQAERDLFLS